MVKIRHARIEDGPAIVALGHFMHAESPRYRDAVYSEARCLSTFESLMGNEFGVVLVATDDEELIGMMVGFVMPPFFSEGLTASEMVLYVAPKWRGSSVAPRLVWTFEHCAQEKGATEISVGVSTGVDADRTTKFYQHLGYTLMGTTLLKRLPCTQGKPAAA